MYVPPAYALSEPESWDVVKRCGAGTFVTSTPSGLASVVAPVLVGPDRSTLRAHVARANPWWREVSDGGEVLILFNLANTYISPGLYPTKVVDPAVAPTWDYVIAEVAGTLRIHDDVSWVESVVRELTERFEAPRVEPWSVDDAPREFVDRLLHAIVGVEVEVRSISAAAKLSQNKNDVDRAAVEKSLAAGNDRERSVADAMRSRR